MTQKYISIMETINRCHKMKNALPCIDFDYSINPYLGYWYAEERLYVIHDCMVNAYFFEIAGSPGEAIERIKKRWEDAQHAGEYVPEEVEE